MDSPGATTRLSHPGMGMGAAKLAREIATLGAGAWAERSDRKREKREKRMWGLCAAPRFISWVCLPNEHLIPVFEDQGCLKKQFADFLVNGREHAQVNDNYCCKHSVGRVFQHASVAKNKMPHCFGGPPFTG